MVYLSTYSFLQYSYGLHHKLFGVDGIRPHNGGFYAVDSLRIEKAYRHWGGEVDTTITPWEAGLGFTVDMKKVVTINYSYPLK